MNLRTKIVAALGNPEAITAEQARALMGEISQRMDEIRGRAAQIAPSKDRAGLGGGDERRRVLLSGEAADLKRIDEEYDALQMERAQLQAQNEALHTIRQDANAREAAQGMPKRIEALASAVKAVEDARAGVVEACKALDLAFREITQARVAAIQSGLPCKDAPAALVDRMIAAHPQRFGRHHPNETHEMLRSVGHIEKAA